ncbi:unnamed protein product [Blepharisma stoltei]|uniref:Peroxin-5 n=1 Tax=Blepharisma stoltei TaxID=1481888 RepID=A0AAU9K5G3_9CILI|nr:unnamed protein product [Blepharisma stoltei]
MDLSKELFNQTACAADGSVQNPLMNAVSTLLTGPEIAALDSEFNNTEHEHFQDAWEEAEVQQKIAEEIPHEQQFEEAWQDQDIFEQAWVEHDPNANPWTTNFSNPTPEALEQFVRMWQQMWPQELPKTPNYVFDEFNPYLQAENPYEIAMDYLANNQINHAILALEAVIMRDPNSSDIWKLLGQLNAENDEDFRAIAALEKGYEIDPYNLDILLSLGMSLINEKSEDMAISHLHTWLSNHPEYHNIQAVGESPREQIKNAFEQARNLNPNDADIYQVLGALNFMTKDYEIAASAFSRALQLKPDDYYIWNRLGATLANQGDSHLAIQAYQKALEIRPSYVRAWANLGIAYANIDEMNTAARFYLCALSLNPNAVQIWNYLLTSFTCLRRWDLIEKLKQFNPMIFKDEYDIVIANDLPQAKHVESDWANEFIIE